MLQLLLRPLCTWTSLEVECKLGWLIAQLTIIAAPLSFCIRKTQFNKPVPVCYWWPCEVTDKISWGLLVPLLVYLLPTDLGAPAWWIREDRHLERQVCVMGNHCSISAECLLCELLAWEEQWHCEVWVHSLIRKWVPGLPLFLMVYLHFLQPHWRFEPDKQKHACYSLVWVYAYAVRRISLL